MGFQECLRAHFYLHLLSYSSILNEIIGKITDDIIGQKGAQV